MKESAGLKDHKKEHFAGGLLKSLIDSMFENSKESSIAKSFNGGSIPPSSTSTSNPSNVPLPPTTPSPSTPKRRSSSSSSSTSSFSFLFPFSLSSSSSSTSSSSPSALSAASSFRIVEDENGDSKTYIGKYEITNKILGHGGNSVVHLGINTKTLKQVAIKCINIPPVKIKSLVKKGDIDFDEVRIMKRLKHPNICQFYDFYVTSSYVYIVLELIQGKELFDLIKASKTLSEDVARKILIQLVSTVQYLHSNGIVHNDIKLENIMLDEENNLTLIDFGHSSFKMGLDEGKNGNTKGFGGVISTLEYAAPELICFGESRYKSEIWSLGVVLFVMVCGYFPFDGTTEEIRHAIVNSKLVFPKDNALSPECIDLIQSMLVNDPDDRIDFTGIKNSPWFLKGFDYYTNDL